MARFYFHLHNSIGFVRDEEGNDLADLQAARRSALESIRSILSEEVRNGQIDLRGRIDIADEAGAVLAVVPFSEAVEVHLRDGQA